MPLDDSEPPPPGQRNPTLVGIPLPAAGSAPMPSEAPPTRQSATDLPAFRVPAETTPPLRHDGPSRDDGPVVESVRVSRGASSGGHAGLLVRALGKWAPLPVGIALVAGVVLWALGGGDGVARVIDAWRAPRAAEVTALRGELDALKSRETKLRVELLEHFGKQAEADRRSRCAIAAVLEAQGAGVPGLCEQETPELLPAPLVRPGRVRRAAPLVQPDTSVPPVPGVPELP